MQRRPPNAAAYRRILVPVDGGAASTRGLELALGIARESGSRVRLLNVFDDTIVAPLTMRPAALAQRRYAIRSMREWGAAALKLGSALAARRGIDVQSGQTAGRGRPVSEVILAVGKRWRADLIVMGTNGRRGWTRLMLGSAAEGVLRDTRVPLLLVRAPGAQAGESRPTRAAAA